MGALQGNKNNPKFETVGRPSNNGAVQSRRSRIMNVSPPRAVDENAPPDTGHEPPRSRTRIVNEASNTLHREAAAALASLQ